MLPKVICTFNAIPIKIPLNFFQRNATHNPKTYMEPEKTPCSQRNVEKEAKVGDITIPDFNSITKLSSPRQYGTGTKTDT